MNYSKIEEAELRKDTFEEAFMSVSEDTTSVLSSVIERHNFIMLDALCYYVEAYSSFFSNACVSLQEMKDAMSTARSTVLEVGWIGCAGEGNSDGRLSGVATETI